MYRYELFSSMGKDELDHRSYATSGRTYNLRTDTDLSHHQYNYQQYQSQYQSMHEYIVNHQSVLDPHDLVYT